MTSSVCGVPQLALLAQAFDGSKLGHGPQQFRLRLGDVHLGAALAHRVFGPLLGCQRSRFVEVARARRRVGQHGDQVRL